MVSLKRIQWPRRRPFEIQPAFKKPLPWQGHLNLFSAASQRGVQPRCGALGKNRVDAGFFTDDPDALVLLVLLAHFADGVVGWKPGFESCRRLKQHPRKRGAQKTQKTQSAKNAEAAPAEASEKISARPNTLFFFSASAMPTIL